MISALSYHRPRRGWPLDAAESQGSIMRSPCFSGFEPVAAMLQSITWSLKS